MNIQLPGFTNAITNEIIDDSIVFISEEWRSIGDTWRKKTIINDSFASGYKNWRAFKKISNFVQWNSQKNNSIFNTSFICIWIQFNNFFIASLFLFMYVSYHFIVYNNISESSLINLRQFINLKGNKAFLKIVSDFVAAMISEVRQKYKFFNF